MEEMEFRAKYKDRLNVKNIDEFTTLLAEMKIDSNDYGACVVATAYIMEAAYHLLDPGLTGFQAGCVMWEMVKKFGSYGPNARLRMLDYGNLKFPQYERHFTHIPQETWLSVVKDAQKGCNEWTGEKSGRVFEHMQTVAEGRVPFGLKIGDS